MRNNRRFGFILLLLGGFLAAGFPAYSADSPLLLQQPAIYGDQVVFVFAGDLWSVPRGGGRAVRLTASPGSETNPAFSPDGGSVAFTGEYEGNVDVYVIPAAGGVPKRLTWHPSSDRVLGWTPDGKKVLFSSNRTAFSRFSELFTVNREGGFPERLPLPMGYEGSYAPDGRRIAYVPMRRAFNVWKRYRGGMATPIWIADLSDSSILKVPRSTSNDFNPMWMGDMVYFLSDRDGPVTLYSFDTRTNALTRVVDNDGLDFKSASAGPETIVYEQFGSLHLYDPQSGATRGIPVTLAGDLAEVRPRFVDVSRRLDSPSLSPNAVRAAFQARGDILTVPAEKGDFRNLSRSSESMERDPAWSPDGSRIAYFSDESGEYMLHIRDQSGEGDIERFALDENPSFYYAPRWSPDGNKIAYVDCHLTLWYLDLESKIPVRVDRGRYYGGTGNLIPSWSPDSKWLAYVKRLPNYLGAVYLYSLDKKASTRITDGMSDARHPVFDAGGHYLYFTASTDSGASYQPDIHSIFRPVTRTVYLAVLSRADPSPFIPESDEEKTGDRTGETGGKPEEKAGRPPERISESGGAPEEAVSVTIDLEGILQRILAVPLPTSPYVELQAGPKGVLIAVEAPAPLPGYFGPEGYTVRRFDLERRKSDLLVEGVEAFQMARNGKKFLYGRSGEWFIGTLRPMPEQGTPASPSPPRSPGKAMPTGNIQIRIDPRAEWRQMYCEAWRIEREFFYDPGLHGLDLEKTRRTYEPYLNALASRQDLNYLFAEMLGEMTVGHLGVGGGDSPRVNPIPTGLLGADYAIENNRFRFARIYNGENWNPRLRAPLTQPGVDVKQGEYLLAVDGREVKGGDNIHRFFEGKTGKQVVLTVGPAPTREGSRDVTVVPVGSESGLRNYAWIEDNRRYVERETGGRAAYVYMPDTAYGGYTYFNRYFYAQVGREAVIVDERFNGGGMLATDIIERLKRNLVSLVATRDGADEAQPQGAIFGPKVMLINEFAGSGGDAMPWYFKQAGVGPLVGKRTWGGLVGRAGAPRLMDGGYVTAPSSGVWSPDGHWIAENVGVAPDVEVELDPELVRQGKDPQLDKAIEIILAELEKNPPRKPVRPPYPDFHKKK